MNKTFVFSLPNCPRCEELKSRLNDVGKVYVERSMEDPAALTDLRCSGVFVLDAPVLQIGDEYFTSGYLFQSGKLKLEGIL